MLVMTLTAQAQSEKRIYTSSELNAMQSRAEKIKLTREQRKELQAIQDSINYAQANKSLANLDFVVEAERLVFRRGETAVVSPLTNFISLNDDKAVVQIAPFNGPGLNGVGGITLNGHASNIKMNSSKKGVTTFTMDVIGNGISAIIEIRLYSGSNNVSVVISPLFNSNKLSLSGTLVPRESSVVFHGRPF